MKTRYMAFDWLKQQHELQTCVIYNNGSQGICLGGVKPIFTFSGIAVDVLDMTA